MKYLIILALLTLSACAPTLKGEGLKVDPAFSPYLTNFINQSYLVGKPVSVNDLTIEFDPNIQSRVPTNSMVLGVCDQRTLSNSIISINPSFWKYASNADREQLLFHELGHCVLSRDHDTTRVGSIDTNSGHALSIMYPYHMGTQAYTNNYDYYMKELFGAPRTVALYSYIRMGTNVFNEAFYTSNASNLVHVSTGKTMPDGSVTLEGMVCGDHAE